MKGFYLSSVLLKRTVMGKIMMSKLDFFVFSFCLVVWLLVVGTEPFPMR